MPYRGRCPKTKPDRHDNDRQTDSQTKKYTIKPDRREEDRQMVRQTDGHTTKSDRHNEYRHNEDTLTNTTTDTMTAIVTMMNLTKRDLTQNCRFSEVLRSSELDASAVTSCRQKEQKKERKK